MIEIKTNATIDEITEEGSSANVEVSCHMEGTEGQLIHEAVSTVRAVSKNLKSESKVAHMIYIATIANDPSILLGEEDGETTAKAIMAEAMSKGLVGDKGVN